MKEYEIYVNRRGINSIEAPRQVEVVTGETLVLKFINLGHPTHVSISAINSQLYTPFIQENLYVSDVEEFEIPIKDGPYAGVFDMEVVTGYGTRKTTLKVFVTAKCEPTPQETPAPETPAGWRITPNLQMGLMGGGVALYVAWLLVRLEGLQAVDTVNAIAFILVVAGIPLTWWYSRRSS